MARWRKLASWLGILAIMAHPGGLMGDITVTNPTENESIPRNTSIGYLGATNMGQDVLVVISINSSEYDRDTVTVPPQDIDWSRTWSAPQGGWTVGIFNRVEVRTGDDVHDTKNFKIVQGM